MELKPADVICDAIAKAQAALGEHLACHDADPEELLADGACIRVLTALSVPEIRQALEGPLPEGDAMDWLREAIASARSALYNWSTETATPAGTVNRLLGILDDETVIEAMTLLGYPPKGVTA